MKNKKNKYEGCGISATLIGYGCLDLAVVKDFTWSWENGRDILVFINKARDKFCSSLYSGGATGFGQNDFYDINKKRHDGKPCYELVKVFKDEKEVIEYLEKDENK